MKREIRFDKVDFEVTASIKKGRLVASLVAEVEATPGNVGRLLNFKKQSTALNLVIEAPQLALDLEFTEVRDPEAEEDDSIPGLPLALKEFKGWRGEGENPFNARLDDVTGQGRTPREAIINAFVLTGVISEEESAEGPEAVIKYVNERYLPERKNGLFPCLEAVVEAIHEDAFPETGGAAVDEHPVGTEEKAKRGRPRKPVLA